MCLGLFLGENLGMLYDCLASLGYLAGQNFVISLYVHLYVEIHASYDQILDRSGSFPSCFFRTFLLNRLFSLISRLLG